MSSYQFASFEEEFRILQEIAHRPSKNTKRAILTECNGNKRMHDLLDATFNYKRKFFIKKWDDVAPASSSSSKDMHDEFLQLLSDLESQKYRGDAAKNMVETFLSFCNELQQEWYSKIIKRDLKAGFGVDSAIDCGFNIPLFEVQLAKDGTQCKGLDGLLKDGLSASRKFDGYRCLAIVDSSDESVTLHTRNGEIFQNFPGVEKSLSLLFNKEHNAKYVLDGEIMSNDFNNTQKSAFASKRGTTVGDMKFHIFDMIPYDEWVSENFITTAFKRYQSLELLFAAMQPQMQARNITNLVMVERTIVYSLDEVLELEKQYITEGFEGVMVNPDIPYYKGKKSNKMLKFKTFKSMDCEVTGVYKGKPGTKYEETLGGLNVIQENEVTCDVGSGFSDQERDEIWNNPSAIVGRIVEIEYQELSKDDQRMRFPVKKRWRPEKDKR